VDIPGQVSVAGYDDSVLARHTYIDLTTISQQPRQHAQHAVAAALDRLDHGRTEPREVVIPPLLVVRGTTGPARCPS
jgi:DNA-binding LacI/PurR family transcriptional regulator